MTRKEAWADCLLLLCGRLPPDDLIPEDDWHSLDEARSARLQDFVASHVLLSWGTGIGTIEAIDLMVTEADINANLADGRRFRPIAPKPAEATARADASERLLRRAVEALPAHVASDWQSTGGSRAAVADAIDAARDHLTATTGAELPSDAYDCPVCEAVHGPGERRVPCPPQCQLYGAHAEAPASEVSADDDALLDGGATLMAVLAVHGDRFLTAHLAALQKLVAVIPDAVKRDRAHADAAEERARAKQATAATASEPPSATPRVDARALPRWTHQQALDSCALLSRSAHYGFVGYAVDDLREYIAQQVELERHARELCERVADMDADAWEGEDFVPSAITGEQKRAAKKGAR